MTEHATLSRRTNVHRAMGILLVGSMAAMLAVKVTNTVTLFHRPGEMTIPAAANVYVARRLQHGGEIYADWTQRPHVAAWYGPALYLPVGLIGRWTGADEQGLFLIGRWISLVSAWCTAALLAWLLRSKWDVTPWIALMTGAVFITTDDVLSRIDISFRADAPACFLTLLGLALVLRSDRATHLYGSVAVFLLSFLFKQSSLVGPAAIVLWLWLTHRRPQAIIYAIASAVPLIGMALLLDATTSGRYFLNTVQALKGNVTLSAVPSELISASRAAVVPCAVALVAVAGEWSRRIWTLPAMSLAVSFALAAALTYRDGADTYYYMLPLALSCLLCGREVGRWWTRRATEPMASVTLTVVLTGASIIYVPTALLRLVDLPEYWHALGSRHEANRQRSEFFSRLTDYLNTLPGPVLSQFDEVGLYCPRSIMIDTFTFTSMADVKAFDDRELIKQIRSGQVDAIVLRRQSPLRYQSTDMFSRRWREAMKGMYQQIQVPGLENVAIYRPIEKVPGGPPAAPAPRDDSDG